MRGGAAYEVGALLGEVRCCDPVWVSARRPCDSDIRVDEGRRWLRACSQIHIKKDEGNKFPSQLSYLKPGRATKSEELSIQPIS